MSHEDNMSLRGVRMVVTGAAMGIGFGIAKDATRHGASVLLCDVQETALRDAMSRLGERKSSIAACLVDVAAEDAPARVVRAACEKWGGIDVLVNNAGIFPRVSMLEMTSVMWDRIFAINLRGLAFLSQAVAQHMLAVGRPGRIINIGSVDSVHPSMVGLAAYDASKAGVLMFTRSLALELAPYDIHVNAVLPGAIDTEGTSRPFEGTGMSEAEHRNTMKRFVDEKVPLRRMGQPHDVASVVRFLASDGARYMTGAHIVVDGGLLLK